jgi:Ni/Co efflux regulator RcnB
MQRLTSLTLAAAVALASLGPTAAMAQGYQPYQPGPYQPGPYQPGPYQPGPYQQGPGYDHHDDGPGTGHHDWRKGDRFYGDRNRVDWRYHHLSPPLRGYEWVRDGDQFMLIGIRSGVIAEVLQNR